MQAAEQFKYQLVESQVRQTGYPPAFADSLIHTFIAGSADMPEVISRTTTTSERLVFKVNWELFNGGYAIVRYDTDPVRPGYVSIQASALSNDFISSFYKVRDFISTILPDSGACPVFFEQHLREGKYSADRWTVYDQPNGKAYSYDPNKPLFSIKPCTQNFMTFLPYLRTKSYGSGDTVSITALVDETVHTVLFRCTAHEQVVANGIKYSCLRVEPVLFGKGRIFSRQDQVQLWFTDDKDRLPVLFKTKLKFGTLIGELIEYESHWNR